MGRHILGLAVGGFTLIFAIVLAPIASYQTGKLEAQLDFIHGKRRFFVCDGSSEFERQFNSILRNEFGVETIPLPLCSSVIPPIYSKRGVRIERAHGCNDQLSEWPKVNLRIASAK